MATAAAPCASLSASITRAAPIHCPRRRCYVSTLRGSEKWAVGQGWLAVVWTVSMEVEGEQLASSCSVGGAHTTRSPTASRHDRTRSGGAYPLAASRS